jgi:hypothetical protein
MTVSAQHKLLGATLYAADAGGVTEGVCVAVGFDNGDFHFLMQVEGDAIQHGFEFQTWDSVLVYTDRRDALAAQDDDEEE